MKKRLIALLLAAVCTFAIAGCSQVSTKPDVVDMVEGVRPVPESMLLSEENSFPYLGMKFNAPEELSKAIEDGLVFADINGEFQIIQNEDGTYMENAPLNFGYILFSAIPENQRARTPHTDSPDAIEDYDTFAQWLMEDTMPFGRISVFRTSYLEGKDLKELTGMETNQELKQVGDFKFYFSTSAPKADSSKEMQALVNTLSAALNTMISGIQLNEPLTVDENYAGIATKEREKLDKVGRFSATDLDGNSMTEDVFRDYDLTMINIWTTWCTPCIEELPHLNELAAELKDQGVQILGIVDDVIDSKSGEPNPETLELAKRVREKIGLSYPILLPDENLRDGILKGIPGYPQTYFVDKDGNIVVDAMLGAHSKAEWNDIIQEVLASVKE